MEEKRRRKWTILALKWVKIAHFRPKIGVFQFGPNLGGLVRTPETLVIRAPNLSKNLFRGF